MNAMESVSSLGEERIIVTDRQETRVHNLMFPDPSVNSEDPLFFHTGGTSVKAGVDTRLGAYYALEGGELHFNSYFNAFPAHLYDLDEHEVLVELEGEGEMVLEITMARHEKSWERLVRTRVCLKAGERQRFVLPDVELNGLVYVGVVAIEDTLIREVSYIIVGQQRQNVSVTGVITTFKRDDAVQRTGKRLQAYFDKNQDLAGSFTLLVIDNGGDTDSIPFINGDVIKNPNLGGAGGFTRGLSEAVSRGKSTHVLFMDDDASFFPESLRRTISLLRFSKSPNMAVSGAMITEALKWRMWENGATFNQRCIPIDSGRDLRNFGEVVRMSVAQPRHVSNKYGGWWYFCFPIASVKTWPFPFFVRGDDSYFSLVNDFDIVTIPGVVAHQEDFFSKQSPLTVYLDFRYHLVHHLTFSGLRLSPDKMLKMMGRYFHRFNNSYHYDTAAALNLAIQDVLSGTPFWQANADMAERRRTIAALSVQEKITTKLDVGLADLARHSPRRNTSRLSKLFQKLTFNGHLAPGFLFYKKGVLFSLDTRAIEHDSFLRWFTVTADVSTGRGYVCRMNKERYFENRRNFNKLCTEVKSRYDNLLEQYSEASSTLTSQDAWAARFNVDGLQHKSS